MQHSPSESVPMTYSEYSIDPMPSDLCIPMAWFMTTMWGRIKAELT